MCLPRLWSDLTTDEAAFVCKISKLINEVRVVRFNKNNDCIYNALFVLVKKTHFFL